MRIRIGGAATRLSWALMALLYGVGYIPASADTGNGYEWAPGIWSSHRSSSGAYMSIEATNSCQTNRDLAAAFQFIYCGGHQQETGDFRAVFRDQYGNELLEVLHQPGKAGSKGFGLYHEHLEKLGFEDAGTMMLELEHWEKDADHTEAPSKACAIVIDPGSSQLEVLIYLDDIFSRFQNNQPAPCVPLDKTEHYLP